MVMAVGGMLRAAELKMIILVDGFIMTNCVLVASPLISGNAIVLRIRALRRRGRHKRILDFLGQKALLDLGLRLGRRFRLGMRLPDTRLRRSHDQ